MAFNWKKARKWLKEHLQKQFLFIIRNEETFEEMASYRLTLQNMYILGSTLLVFLSVILFLLIIFSPIKTYIPGYGDPKSQDDYIDIDQKIKKLEESLMARDTYINSLRRVLSDNPETSADVTKNVQIKLEKPEALPKVREDSVLRAEFEAFQSLTDLIQPGISGLKSSKNSVRYKKTETENFRHLIFVSPVRGPLGASYALEKGHLGVDIIAAANTPIKAVLDGSIIQADWSIENGHTITIQHSNNLVSIYKHNSALLKKTGSHVKAGEAIAIIGNTGTLTDGPHLHFELWFKGRPVNPVEFIRF